MHNQTLIRDHEVFEFNYTPETIHYRDIQLRQLAGALSPALQGARPINANLRGPPGTGKTTCVRRIFNELEETTSRVVPVFVNCENVNTAFRVFSAVFERLFGHQPPLSGIPVQRLTDPIAAELIQRKAVLIVCLDDAHHLSQAGHLDMVIRSLVRMYEHYPGVKVGVVTTISDRSFCPVTVLDPAVVSVWHPEEIPFPDYGKEEVHTILQDRVRIGLYPGVIPPEILDHIVALTMEGGDLRVGIDLLKHAVTNAEWDARTGVMETDVTTAYTTVRGAHLVHLIDGLKPGPKRLLFHIIQMKQTNPMASLTSSILYESFKATRDISYTAFRNWLRKLSDLRLIDIRQRSAIGNAHEIEIRFDPGLMDDMRRT
jgi:cell division control protein 6